MERDHAAKVRPLLLFFGDLAQLPGCVPEDSCRLFPDAGQGRGNAVDELFDFVLVEQLAILVALDVEHDLDLDRVPGPLSALGDLGEELLFEKLDLAGEGSGLGIDGHGHVDQVDAAVAQLVLRFGCFDLAEIDAFDPFVELAGFFVDPHEGTHFGTAAFPGRGNFGGGGGGHVVQGLGGGALQLGEGHAENLGDAGPVARPWHVLLPLPAAPGGFVAAGLLGGFLLGETQLSTTFDHDRADGIRHGARS